MSDISLSEILTQLVTFVTLLLTVATLVSSIAALRRETLLRTKFEWASEAWHRETNAKVKSELHNSRINSLAVLRSIENVPLSPTIPSFLFGCIVLSALSILGYAIPIGNYPALPIPIVLILLSAFLLQPLVSSFKHRKREQSVTRARLQGVRIQPLEHQWGTFDFWHSWSKGLVLGLAAFTFGTVVQGQNFEGGWGIVLVLAYLNALLLAGVWFAFDKALSYHKIALKMKPRPDYEI